MKRHIAVSLALAALKASAPVKHEDGGGGHVLQGGVRHHPRTRSARQVCNFSE
jgi:hypothetical protein